MNKNSPLSDASGHQGDANIYLEDFQDGPGGWYGFKNNFDGPMPLKRSGQAVASFGPWWIDYNHAPPGGAGYLSLLFCMMTRGPLNEALLEYGGSNRFINQKFPTDFTDAKLNVQLRGELLLRGAQVVLLVQSSQQNICSGWMLTSQPMVIEKEWADHTLVLTPDESQWTSLGSRLDRADTYGHLPLKEVLADVNVNFIFVLFPLDVRPKGDFEGDPNVLRPGRDYRVWQAHLPDGYVLMKSISIQFSS